MNCIYGEVGRYCARQGLVPDKTLCKNCGGWHEATTQVVYCGIQRPEEPLYCHHPDLFPNCFTCSAQGPNGGCNWDHWHFDHV